MPKTDHSKDIEELRRKASNMHPNLSLVMTVCADLLELHDRQSLSLDDWASARCLVEIYVEHPIQKNGV